MDESDLYYLPEEVRAGLAAARARDRKVTGGRLRVQMGEIWYPIHSFDDTGFEITLDAMAGGPMLRGLVDIYKGPRMIRSVLIIAREPDGETMRYDFKRTTAPRTQAPLDYERTGDAPAGFIAGT